ncbi:MAG: nickel pincer cofactor biosynthesis protein LarC [Solobacterium sp.]|nr:nickel pincer cofactor biosynthesis protein LarC [Solobacterium sp.]
MKTLYFDCGMGAAGDMLTASLVELTPDPDKTIGELNALQIPDVEFVREATVKCGIAGTNVRVMVKGMEEDEHMHDHGHHHEHTHEHHHDHDHEHHHDHDHEHDHHHSHTGMHAIEHIVNDHIAVSDKVKKDILAVYQLIAEAESKVHNTSIEDIHFHEVGTMDAVADITAFCYLIDQLGPDQILASPIHVGKGTVRCAHGILPVPAPATALILKGIPVYSREDISGELCTPTGAALLKHFVSEFRSMPVMSIEKIGYGMGKKDFTVMNTVRSILGETEPVQTGEVRELDFNVDDMTGEQIGFATEVLMKNGAREVFVTPVFMKKNRPGHLISVLCGEEKKDELVRLIFRHTTTIGIRETIKNRYVMERKVTNVETPFGTIRRKESHGYGTDREKYEYDDLAEIAEKENISIRELLEKIG